jgi:hypothetical protein
LHVLWAVIGRKLGHAKGSKPTFVAERDEETHREDVAIAGTLVAITNVVSTMVIATLGSIKNFVCRYCCYLSSSLIRIPRHVYELSKEVHVVKVRVRKHACNKLASSSMWICIVEDLF